jgi:CheY-like chemotaxis protein
MARILVVDDEVSCRTPLARLLQLDGFETMVAGDGQEALEALEKAIPDLILLDLIMPRMDGVEFLDAVRKDGRFSSVPVLIVTGVHDSKRMTKAMSLGAKEYLFKCDVPFPKLLVILKKYVGDPAPTGPGRPDAARADSGRAPAPGRTENGRLENDRSDSGRGEPDRSQPGRSKSTATC